MQTNEGLHIQFPEPKGNAYNNDQGLGLMPPDFSLTSAGTETQEDVINRHKKNTELVESIVTEMSQSTNDTEKNTADWIKNNEINFYVGTQTHDSAKRGESMLNDPDDRAYFGAKQLFPNPIASYSETEMPDWDNCTLANKDTFASAYNNDIRFYDPLLFGSSKSSIKETIIHEIQHHADRHNEDGSKPADNVNVAWDKYKSEFRSYWVSGEYDSFSPTKEYQETGFNERQWEIYYHLFSNYDYVKKYKDDVVTQSETESEKGIKMDTLISDYASPDGVNLENSLRIENVMDALVSCTSEMGLEQNEIKELVEACKQLSENEKMDVFMDPNKKPVKDKLQALNIDVYKVIHNILSGTDL